MKRKQQNNKKPVESRSSWRVIVMAILCVLLFVAGFFLAGRQHFSSMDYGMKNSKLRKQIEDLESEKRRLILAREISLSPNEIRKAAKKIGLVDGAAGATLAQAQPQPASSVQPAPVAKSQSPAASNPLVMKTAAISSTAAVTPAVIKGQKPEKETKTVDAALKQMKRTVAAE